MIVFQKLRYTVSMITQTLSKFCLLCLYVTVSMCANGATVSNQPRVRLVNMMPDVRFSNIVLLGEEGKATRGVKFGKGSGFAKKQPGACSYSLHSAVTGAELIPADAFPAVLKPDRDYVFIVHSGAETTQPVVTIVDNLRTYGPAVPEKVTDSAVINCVVGDSFILGSGGARDKTGSWLENDFGTGDACYARWACGCDKLEFRLLDRTSHSLVVKASVPGIPRMYYIVFGGTVAPDDAFPLVVNTIGTRLGGVSGVDAPDEWAP